MYRKEELTKLIQEAKAGDYTAFEKVMMLKARQIIYICVKLLHNQQDGEDAAQEAMLKMYQNIASLKNPAAFHTWMYQIVTRTCINFGKRRNRYEHDYLEEKDELNEMRREFLPQDYIEDADKQRFLLQVIDSLPEFYRTCLLLFYYEDMSYQEIAESLEITEKTVSNTLFRAKRKIKQTLEAEYGSKADLLSYQGLAALPVLSQVFQGDAAMQATPEVIAKVVAGASAAIKAAIASGASAVGSANAGVGNAATAGNGTAAAGNSTASLGSSGALTTSSKIIIGLVAAATATGAGLALLPNGSEALAQLTNADGQEELLILTLEDMIGEEAAAELRAYVRGEGVAVQWGDFLDRVSVSAIAGAEDGAANYVLFHLEKQDKQLLILQKTGPTGLEVAYRFTDRHETPPVELELIDSLGRWGQ